MLIYKIVHRDEWPDAEDRGVFEGSPKDRADGFLHFSTFKQVPVTLARYYSKESDLVLVAVESDVLGSALRFEPSTGCDLYPHLYGSLPLSATKWVRALKRGPDGEFVSPV